MTRRHGPTAVLRWAGRRRHRDLRPCRWSKPRHAERGGDQTFGPLVTVGLGGTSTDLVADRAHRLVPLTDVDAAEMLGDFRAGARLFDPRRGPTPERAAVLDVIVRVGRLAETLPEVVELDLNPVVLGPSGCVIVDARIRVAPAVVGDPALRALGR